MEQLLSLCTTGQTSQRPALYTILHRVINTASDSEFESVLPVLLSLTSGIYVTKGKQMAPNVSSSLSDTLYNVRDTMRLSISIQSSEIDTTSMSNKMVDTVADQICESFKLVISDESSSPNLENYEGDKINMIHLLENEIESLLAQQPVSNDGGVLELMTRRDCRKTAAEKSSIVAKLILPSQKESREQNGGMPNSDMNGGAEITFSNLFGDQFHAFQRSRSAYLSLESRLNSLNATWVQERNQISTEIETCQTDLTRIESRKQELQKELDSLNNEENRLTKREELLKQRLEAVYNSSSTPEVDEMKAEMKERAGLIDVEEKVKGVSEKLSNMSSILSSQKNKERGAQNGNHVDINSVEVQSKLESFLILVKNYFIAEADCVNFMQKRVAKIQHDAKDLVSF